MVDIIPVGSGHDPNVVETKVALAEDSYFTHAEDTSFAEAHGELKVDKASGVVLSPQPTNDPNDPLNWPVWLKVYMTWEKKSLTT